MTTPPSHTHVLTNGRSTARIDEVGAALLTFTHDGHTLVGSDDDEPVPTPPYRGMVLAPWPNRIPDGAYTFGGARLQLPVNEVERHNALHGLTLWHRWRRTARSEQQVRLEHTIWPQHGYPFQLDLSVHYLLADDRLSVTIRARNSGTTPAPYGVSIHPYLLAPGGGLLDDWTMHLPCDSVLTVDEALRPLDLVDVTATPFDYRVPRRIGADVLDHAFAVADGAERAATLRAPDGRGVSIEWDDTSTWLQVYTLEHPTSTWNRRAVAIEPMTCPPGAFASGKDVIVLGPREVVTSRWTIRALAPT